MLWRWPQNVISKSAMYDDIIKWKHFPRYWPFVRGRRGALVFSLICAWIKGWVNKQSWSCFETPSRLLWRHCNGMETLVRLILSCVDVVLFRDNANYNIDSAFHLCIACSQDVMLCKHTRKLYHNLQTKHIWCTSTNPLKTSDSECNRFSEANGQIQYYGSQWTKRNVKISHISHYPLSSICFTQAGCQLRRLQHNHYTNALIVPRPSIIGKDLMRLWLLLLILINIFVGLGGWIIFPLSIS